uniref:Uncharacterized protein n=1 Tax=Romanomermis culicivorax TaxID=13658 RepID=A0A915KUU0_ROMCU
MQTSNEEFRLFINNPIKVAPENLSVFVQQRRAMVGQVALVGMPPSKCYLSTIVCDYIRKTNPSWQNQ